MAQKKFKLPLAVLILLSLVGIGLSVALTQHFYEIRSGVASLLSSCNLGSKMNCNAVAASPYAELVSGIPLSSFTTGWFLALLFTYLVAFGVFGDEGKKKAYRAALVMNLFALVLGAIYFGIMVTKIGSYCLYCLGLDAINIVSTGLTFWIFKSSRQEPGADLQTSDLKTYLGVIAGCLFIAVVSLKGMDKVEGSRGDFEEMANQILNTAPVSVNSSPTVFASMGPADAPITIVEFSDFECPYCRFGAMGLNTLQSRYPKQVRIVFRNYPLDMHCNPRVDHPMHEYSCEAAKVGICAQKQDKFEPYYDTIFENQASLKDGMPLETAKTLGMDPAAITACVASQETTNRLLGDIEEGTRLGVNSTPTFFINGRKVEGARPIPAWDIVVEKLLHAGG